LDDLTVTQERNEAGRGEEKQRLFGEGFGSSRTTFMIIDGDQQQLKA
jgi:hypothetical protein